MPTAGLAALTRVYDSARDGQQVVRAEASSPDGANTTTVLRIADWADAQPEYVPVAPSTMLHQGQSHIVSAAAVNADGRESAHRHRIDVPPPAKAFAVCSTRIADGGVYGTGMPITLAFSAPVTNRQAVEDNLHMAVAKGRFQVDEISAALRTAPCDENYQVSPGRGWSRELQN